VPKVRVNVKILPSVIENCSLPLYLALEAEPTRQGKPDDLICEVIKYLVEEGKTLRNYALEKDSL